MTRSCLCHWFIDFFTYFIHYYTMAIYICICSSMSIRPLIDCFSEKYIFSSDRRRTVYLFYTSWFTCGLRSVQLMYSCVQSEDCTVLVAHLWLQWGSLPVLYRPLVTPSSEPWSPQQWHEASTDNTPSLRTPVTQSSAQIRVRVNKQQPEDSPISNSPSSRNLRNWTNVTTFGKKR